MKRSIAALAIVLGAGVASAQVDLGNLPTTNKYPVRIPIRHADPWFIKAMLEGTSLTQPEYSTIEGARNFGGGGGGGGGFGGGFGGGNFGGGQGAGGNRGGQNGFGGGQSGGGGFGGGGNLSGGGAAGPGGGGGGSFGGGNRGGGGGGGGIGGGAGGNNQRGRGLVPPGWYIVVNPTDNSLWLYPERN